MEARFETFTALITKISRNIRRIKTLEMAEFDLKSPHVSCLYHLYMAKGLTATALAEKCEEDKAAISRSLDYLEQNGFLVCDAEKSKRYKSRLTLTEKGEMVGREISRKVEGVLCDVSVGLSDRDREDFYRYLHIISQNLDDICKKLEKV